MNIFILWFSCLVLLILAIALSGYVALALCVSVVYLQHYIGKAFKALSVVFMTHKTK